ncbi:ML domain-containing protein [Lenzites betulinus]|nr:ML domain-containing protein [Lenzites betulinus]
MARFRLILLLAAALGYTAASPIDEQALDSPSFLAPGKDRGWKDCGEEGDVVRIKSIEVSPDPPKRGEDLTITVTGDASDDILDGAYADVTVKLGLITILRKQFDVCEEAEKANATIQCPISKGHHVVVQTVTLAKEIPPAPFKVNIRGYTGDDDDLVCMDLMMDFWPKRGSFLQW